MDWLIVIGIGALVGGFHGVGVAVIGYALFWLVLIILAAIAN